MEHAQPMQNSSHSFACAAAAAVTLWGCSPAEDAQHVDTPFARNVVIFSVDTLRADLLGAYGNTPSPTPRFDRLAEQSLVFDAAYSPATITNPSLTSMLTGLLPPQHGVHEQNSGFAKGIVTIPLVAKGSGIATGSFLANMCKLQDTKGTVYHDGWDERFCGMLDDPENYSDQYLWDEAVVDATCAWIDEQDRPFLAWAHLMDPHAEHRPPPRLWDWEGDEPREKYEQYAYYNEFEAERTMPPDEVKERLWALYSAEVTGSDDQLGRMLDYLEDSGHADDTAVIATSDHGEELFETWVRYDHGFSMTEGVFRVPLMVRAAGVEPGRIAAPVELSQVAPTVLELFDLEPAYELSGQSLLAEQPSRGYALSYGGMWTTSIRTQAKRYWLRHLDEAPTREEAAWRLEGPWFTEPELLCEYAADAPTIPVYLDATGEHAPDAGRMRAEITFRHDALPRFGKGVTITDPALAESLRALGYLDYAQESP